MFFLTEELTFSPEGFINFRTGKGQWSDRLREALLQIDADFVLYFQEDMWLSEPVDGQFFQELFKFAQDQKAKQIKVHSSEVYKTIASEHYVQGLNVALVEKATSRFLMSHQVTLWSRLYFIEQLKPNEHPWRNERRGTKRMKNNDVIIHHVDYFSENGKPAINLNKDEAVRSAYYTVSGNAKLNEFVLPYLKILKTDKPHLFYAEKLKEHYENGLTHDGKPVPRKSFLKKVKFAFASVFGYSGS